MIKKFYRIIIFPYTLFLLYLMFLGMGRTRLEDNLLTIRPVLSTIDFIKGCTSWKQMVTIVAGNVIMFMPFGFLGWVFPKLMELRQLLFTFVSAITIVEGLQYFTRMGIFEVDDILLNTSGVYLGFLIRNLLERRYRRLAE